MPSIINIDNGQISGTPAVRITAAGDGVLQIQNNGNTAIAISNTGNATFAGNTTFSNPIVQTIPLLNLSFGAQTVSNSTLTKHTNETVILDNYGWWDAGNNRWVVQIPGWYEIIMNAFVNTSSGNTISLHIPRLYVNGVNVANSTARPRELSDSRMVLLFRQFSAGDYIEAYNSVYGTGTLQMSAIVTGKLIQRDPV
jgi:hypothetical protein